MREIITLNDFSYTELSSNPGLRLKMDKVFRDFLHEKLAYFEVIYVDVVNESLYMYAVNTQWYSYCIKLDATDFSKRMSFKLEAAIAIASLPDESEEEAPIPSNHKTFLQIVKEKELESRGIYLNPDQVAHFNLDNLDDTSEEIFGIQSPYKTVQKELTLQMQSLVVGNDFIQEKGQSSKYDVNLKSFKYKELHDIVLPAVRELVPSSAYIRITERTEFSLKVLVVTNEAQLYQFTYSISDRFSQMFSRYLNYLTFDEKVSEFKLRIKEYVSNLSLAEAPDYEKGLFAAIQSMTFEEKRLKAYPLKFAEFVFKHTCTRDTNGDENGHLRNVNQFYQDLTDDENEMKTMIIKQFMAAKTFESREIAARQKSDFESKLKKYNGNTARLL